MKKILLIFCELFALSRAFELQCNFASMLYDPTVDYIYSCYTAQPFDAADQTVTSVSGTHRSGFSDADVRGLFVRGSAGLSFVPRGASQFFPNIRAVDVTNTSIAALDGSEFSEFGQRLEVLVFSRSEVTALPSKLFARTPRLTHVNFNFNRIERVGAGLFAPLAEGQLKAVYFFENRCTSLWTRNETEIGAVLAAVSTDCPFEGETIEDDPVEGEKTTPGEGEEEGVETTPREEEEGKETTPEEEEEGVETTPEPEETEEPSGEEGGSSCSSESSEEAICGLKESVSELKSELEDAKNELLEANEELASELEATKAKLASLEEIFGEELQKVREELASQCSCQ